MSDMLLIADSRITQLDWLLDTNWKSAIIVQTLLPTAIKGNFSEIDDALTVYFDNDGGSIKCVMVISGPFFDITEQSYLSTFKVLKHYLQEAHKILSEKIVFSVASDCELTAVLLDE
jgi:hypothetical protein